MRFARLATRIPGLKRLLTRLLRLSPALDLRLRGLLVHAAHPPSPLQVDAKHIPASALAVFRELQAAIERERRR